MGCKRCGYCCTLIPVISPMEKLRIALHGYKNFSEKDINGKTCIRLINKGCCFLQRKDDGTTECKIYRFRPKVCRDFHPDDSEECHAEKTSLKKRIINKKY
jgi:Fe-S-cluster containining protein